jgi:hypothetical protein
VRPRFDPRSGAEVAVGDRVAPPSPGGGELPDDAVGADRDGGVEQRRGIGGRRRARRSRRGGRGSPGIAGARSSGATLRRLRTGSRYRASPFTDPQVAAVGLTEEQAREIRTAVRPIVGPVRIVHRFAPEERIGRAAWSTSAALSRTARQSAMSCRRASCRFFVAGELLDLLGHAFESLRDDGVNSDGREGRISPGRRRLGGRRPR